MTERRDPLTTGRSPPAAAYSITNNGRAPTTAGNLKAVGLPCPSLAPDAARTESRLNAAAHFFRDYVTRVQAILSAMDPAPVGELVDALLAVRAHGGTVWTCGNGGSASTAEHFASDLVGTLRLSANPFRAICLSSNIAAFSAAANDYGYENAFSRQLDGRITSHDLLVAISASGNSPNVLSAVEYARRAGARVAGLTGFDGGLLRERADIAIHVPSEHGEYGPCEDLHMVVKHGVTMYLDRLLSGGDDPRLARIEPAA